MFPSIRSVREHDFKHLHDGTDEQHSDPYGKEDCECNRENDFLHHVDAAPDRRQSVVTLMVGLSADRGGFFTI